MPNKKAQVKSLQEQTPRVKVPPRDRIDEQAAPRVEILPELSPNTDTGSDAPRPNTGILLHRSPTLTPIRPLKPVLLLQGRNLPNPPINRGRCVQN